MKNMVKCENCNTENDFFRMNCRNCSSLLRDKFPNIDLFSTIWQLIESPSSAIKKIIYAEHKNYQLFILLLILLKLTFTSFFLQSVLIEPVNYKTYFGINFSIAWVTLLLLFVFTPLLIKIVLKKNNVITRYKDNLAILIYSQIPIVLFLVLVLPIEFALYGKYWLFSNPSPFFINPVVAYIFSFLELLTIIWSYVLLGISLKIQSNSKMFAWISTLTYVVILLVILLFIPYLG